MYTEVSTNITWFTKKIYLKKIVDDEITIFFILVFSSAAILSKKTRVYFPMKSRPFLTNYADFKDI